VQEKEETPMPTWRNKPPNREHLNKRYTPRQQQERRNAALAATRRLYCDVLQFWRGCEGKGCRRHLRCVGEPAACLKRGWANVSRKRQRWAFAEVVAGGPRRIPPANHSEWGLRRTPASTIVS
jgi:hypothetical protein